MAHFKDVNLVFYYVTHWDQAKKFYDEVLDWPVAWSDDDSGWREYGVEGAAHIAIHRWGREEPLPTGGGGTVTLTVDDPEATAAWLRSKGVRCDEVVTIPGVVSYGTFYDPDGNRIQFAASKPPPADG